MKKYALLAAILVATSTAVMAKNDKKEHKYTAAVPVPDAGSTVVMLGMALGGLGLLRKAWMAGLIK